MTSVDNVQPAWTGKFVNSYVSRVRSYLSEHVVSGVKSSRDINGNEVDEYVVGLEVVFDMSMEKATAHGMVTEAQYKLLSKKVYNRLNATMSEGSTVFSDLTEDDGRAALVKLKGTLGNAQNQLQVLHDSLTELKCNGVQDYFRFEEELGRILKEWAMIMKDNEGNVKISEQKRTEGANRQSLMIKIADVFSDIHRDASKLTSTDTFESIKQQCRNHAMLYKTRVRPTSHFNRSKIWNRTVQRGIITFEDGEFILGDPAYQGCYHCLVKYKKHKLHRIFHGELPEGAKCNCPKGRLPFERRYNHVFDGVRGRVEKIISQIVHHARFHNAKNRSYYNLLVDSVKMTLHATAITLNQAIGFYPSTYTATVRCAPLAVR